MRLTPRGAVALETRASIALRFRTSRTRQRKKERADGPSPTALITGRAFEEGLRPEQIAVQRGLSVSTVYRHIAQLIGAGKVELSAVVEVAVADQVRAAIEQAGGVAALSPIKALLPEAITYNEIACVVADVKRQRRPSTCDSGGTLEDPISEFLSRSHPVALDGSWEAGWALGFHSRFSGGAWSRSEVGDFLYRLKYKADAWVLQPIVERAAELAVQHPELTRMDAIVPIPPSMPRDHDPVRTFADALALEVGSAVWPILRKTRQTAPQKDMSTRARKRSNVRR